MKKWFVFLFFSSIVSHGYSQANTEQRETAKMILGLLQQNEFGKVESFFDTAFAQRMTVERLEKLWKFVNAQGGAFVGTKELTEDEQRGFIKIIQVLEFKKDSFNLNVSFNKRNNKVASMSFTPYRPVEMYKLPGYYDSTRVVEKQVKVISGKFTLPGILSLPNSGGKFPAVVLVHGSGANDRDETVGSTKIFKDIALGLAMKGVAVLRYDKRTKVNRGRMLMAWNTMTVKDETTDDAIAAVQLLKADPSIDTNRIFMLGHGLGGMLLPRIAAELPNLAGLFMVAANARPLEDNIFEQAVFLYGADTSENKKVLLDSLQVQVDKIKHLNANTPDTSFKKLFGLSKSYWVDLNNYHQVEVAKETKMPLYILHGERDYQVPMVDFDLWKKELASKKNVQLKLYPKLNHLLQEGEGKSGPIEYNRQANVPLYVIDDLANWIATKKKK